jgi:hypothetical protein
MGKSIVFKQNSTVHLTALIFFGEYYTVIVLTLKDGMLNLRTKYDASATLVATKKLNFMLLYR